MTVQTVLTYKSAIGTVTDEYPDGKPPGTYLAMIETAMRSVGLTGLTMTIVPEVIPEAPEPDPYAVLALRAKTGAALLDLKRPGWADEAADRNLSSLNMASISNDILARVYGDYYTGKIALGLSEGAQESDAAAFGFYIRDGSVPDVNKGYRLLGDEWRIQVTSRTEGS
jgi:hypothetical protein